MPPIFSPIPGAQGFQQSNPSVFATVSLLGSLQIFKEAGLMRPLRERSVQLTGDLEERLLRSKYFVSLSDVGSKFFPDATGRDHPKPGFTIITPSHPESRGAQLSLLFLPEKSAVMRRVFEYLISHGVIIDERDPDVIRMTPAPLFNTLEDCERTALCLEQALDSLGGEV
jgi:kynureninase